MSDPGDEILRALFEAASDPIVVCDERGVIARANPACRALLGYAPDALVGRPVEMLIPKRYANHELHRARYAANPHARAMGATMDLEAVHQDGREIPVDIALTPIVHGGRRWVAATLRDMRGRARTLQTLRVQATALRSAANGVVITDRSGTISWVNPAACTITGYDAEELVGAHTRKLRSGQHAPDFYASLWRTVLGGQTWSGTIVNRRKDGTLYDEEQTIAPVVDDGGVITHFIAIKQDVTDRRRTEAALERAQADLAARVAEIESLNRKLRDQAVRDPLTGLYNRRYFDETIAREVALASRNGEALSLVALDVDHFKRVNDTHGHALGDRVLQELAGVLRARVRASDIACRFGGEEFLLVLQGAPLDVAVRRAEEVRSDFEALAIPVTGGAALTVTVSIGVTELHELDGPGHAIPNALARADAALYSAKRAGRNQVVSVRRDSSAPA